jgi:hypothetical protein
MRASMIVALIGIIGIFERAWLNLGGAYFFNKRDCLNEVSELKAGQVVVFIHKSSVKPVTKDTSGLQHPGRDQLRVQSRNA